MMIQASAAVLALALAGTASADVLMMRPMGGSPPASADPSFLRALDRVHAECDADVERVCRRPQDDLDNLLRGSIFFPMMDSGPAFRLMVRDDPFVRMAMTPPSLDTSPRLLGEAFGGMMVGPTVTVTLVDDSDDLGRALDAMVESAIRVAFAPLDGAERPEVPTTEVPAAEAEEVQDPVDMAVRAMDAMVDSLLDHAAASASASGSADAEEGLTDQVVEEVEKDEDEHSHGSRDSDGGSGESGDYDPVPPVRESTVSEAEVLAPSSKDPFHATWDPVVLSKKIADHGREMLAAEEKAEEGPGRGEFRRRRLTEEHPDVRRRLARRLTEVVPFGRLLASLPEPEPVSVPTPVHSSFHPRLGYGCQADRCLVSAFRAADGTLSRPCREAIAAAMETMPTNGRRTLSPPSVIMTSTTMEAIPSPGPIAEAAYRLCLVAWAMVATLLLWTCIFGADEEADDGEEGRPDATDYILVEDDDDDEEEEQAAPQGGAVAFVGVPIRVV